MDLKKASEKAYEIAQKRGLNEDTIQALKHCAGEVLEAVESYTKYVYSSREKNDSFPDELADVIMCILSICGAENIDIEQALCRCFFKNEKRAEGVKNDSSQ